MTDGGVLAQLRREVVHEGLGAIDAGAVRQRHHGEQIALVFGGQEAARNLHDEYDVRDDDRQEGTRRRTRVIK